MGLLNECTTNNLVILQDRNETYSKTRINGTWSYTHPVSLVQTWLNYAWELHRYCVAHYKYVGITYEAAKAKAEELTKYYTRTTKSSLWGNNENLTFIDYEDGWKCMAQLSINKVSGCMYELEVRVNEDDAKIRSPFQFSGGTTGESLFNEEHNRSYEI